MKKIFITLLSIILCYTFSNAQNLNAAFTANETEKEILKQGFDNPDEMTGWEIIKQNTSNSWQLGNLTSLVPNFSTINSASVYSLMIRYDDYINQNEEALSPVFTVISSTRIRFYAAFDGVYSMYAPLTVEVEEQPGKERTEIFNSFIWSQENGHERHKWLKFELDLSAYDGKSVRIVFKYKGKGGDYVFIDDFSVLESGTGDDAKATINEGETVSFIDMSEGNPTAWEWTFAGGEPATSTEQNPTVKYNTAGIYNVTLKVSDGTTSNETTRTGFVVVQGVAPIAAFDFPTEGYLSPEAAIFIPANTAVTYTDRSKNIPTQWIWTLPGTESTTYSVQNPTVTYNTEGVYDARLKVENAQGTDLTEYIGAVKVGGTCPIWNIGMDESASLDAIVLPWGGYYGGSNYFKMYSFAERYEKPAVKSEVNSVDIYFYDTKAETPVDIIVSLRNEINDLPGDILATASISTSDLVNDPSTWLPTTFTFTDAVSIEEPFFVVVEGIPSRMDSFDQLVDNVVIAGIRRDDKATRQSTVYHYGPVYDNPEAGDVWLKNEDENVSFAITPKLTYIPNPTGIEKSVVTEKGTAPSIIIEDKKLTAKDAGESYIIKIYNTTGGLVKQYNNLSGDKTVDMPDMSGVYIIQVLKGDSVWSYKVINK